MEKTNLWLLAFLLALALPSSLCAKKVIYPGQLWYDDRGIHINAHGGGVLYHDGTYYWYGEHKAANTSSALVGVTCYSSRDLVNWKYRGVALSVSDSVGSDIERGCILERPKVIYNAKTKKFVLWFHLELKDKGYAAARYGVAISDSPVGPFRYLRSGRVLPGKYSVEMTPQSIATMDTLNTNYYKEWWTPTWREAIVKGLFFKRDFAGGQMARDQTVYVDDDGKAYHIYSSEDNLTLQIAELTDDYTAHTGRFARMAPGGQNEAPAILKRNGKYWMITSGCTGWEPNEARMFSADNIFGPWTQHPSPCVGPNAKKTFDGQSTYILQTTKGEYIFMADIWRPKNPIDARYIWLPIRFDGETPVVEWQDEWQVNK